ncbi:MAG TPA: type IV pilus twitching motility protein PilT [Abditibacteriaceae bacterium]
MAHIDQLIARMAQGKIERAMLVNDKPAHLYAGGHDTPGPAIPLAQLQNVLQEITPAHLKPNLAVDSTFHFPYHSPHGDYEIGVARTGHSLQISIVPASLAHAADAGTAQANTTHADTSHADAAPQSTTENGAPAGANSFAGPAAPATPAAPRGTRRIEHIDELFRLMKQVEASDLHLSADETPMFRLHGIMKKLDEYEVSTHETLYKLLMQIAPERNKTEWDAEKDSDFAYELPGVARFRCNYFADRKGIGAVFRLIPSEVLTVEQLNLPKVMTDLCFLSKGLVVVTGPTGSGKSTTLAALIDFINKHREDHLITIEDPVEFVHNNIKCLINQREVHVHTSGFKRALRAALREDPDIVLVGEMRDLETIAIAIETAETGHLVFGTLHTTTAPSTVDRIIDQFPSDQQAQIRVMLSESLKGVIAQTLLRTTDGKRVAAHEILLVPTAVSNLIREGKTYQLASQMQIGKSQGMVTMNDSIVNFVKAGRVDPMEGYIKAVDKLSLLQAYAANGIDSPVEEEAKLIQ